MRIGVLTGGGDVPGLNPCIKALVYRAIDEGHEVLGIRRGWAGLLYLNPDDPETEKKWGMSLDKQVTRTIDRTGGTFIHTSRTNPGKVRPKDIPEFVSDPGEPEIIKGGEGEEGEEVYDLTPHVMRVIEHLGIDVLVPIGDDDTLGYGLRLHNEGVPMIGIPKTMDNDVAGTDYCIGFSTAITRSVDIITNLRTSIGSHERIGVIELFGRYCGETSLFAAYLSGADRCIISEEEFDVEKLAAFLMEDKQANPSNYAVMTISEGARMEGEQMVQYGPRDAYGHKKLGGIGLHTADALKKLTGENTLYQMLSYLMRSGAPDSLDRMVAVSYANLAMSLINAGQTGKMVALRDGKYTSVPMDVVSQSPRQVNVDELYDKEQYRPKVTHLMGKPMFLY